MTNVYYKIRQYTDYYYAPDQFDGDQDIVKQFKDNKVVPISKWRDFGVQVVKCVEDDDYVDCRDEVLADKSW